MRIVSLLPAYIVAVLPASAFAVDLVVHDYAPGDGPANLVSSGVPFAPGQLLDARNIRVLDGATELSVGVQVLATWPDDQSIRVALLQFEANFAGATKTFELSLGTARSGPDRPMEIVDWRFPRKIATLGADYLAPSLVMWEQKPHAAAGTEADWIAGAVNNFAELDTEPDPAETCARIDQYYDSANSSYGLYVRTGELQYLLAGRRWSYHHARDQVHLSGPDIGHGICGGSYVDNTRYTFVDSLVRDYWFFGDPESLRVAGLITDNFYVPHEARWYYQAPNTRGFWTEREAAFAQLGLIAYYEATGDTQYLDLARMRVARLHDMQVDNNSGAWVHNLYDHDPEEGCAEDDYGSSSFMSGLMFEGLIRYHKLTCDQVALASIRMATNYLRINNVATGDYAGASLIYLGCPATNPDYTNGNPDLDNLVSHAFGYAYRASGFTSTIDRDFGRALFDTSVDEGFLRAPKQYNQGLRSSGNFVAYVDPAIAGLKDCNASPQPDAGVIDRDAGALDPDATSSTDAQTPNADAATQPTTDAGVISGADAGVLANSDGGIFQVGDDEESGCGCNSSSSSEGASLFLVALGAVALSRSRRTRATQSRCPRRQ